MKRLKGKSGPSKDIKCDLKSQVVASCLRKGEMYKKSKKLEKLEIMAIKYILKHIVEKITSSKRT